MSKFFKPYEGRRPFLFVSYPHKNSDAVLDTIRILHDRGYRLWYDEGIPAGSDWPANIARHVNDCDAVLFFLAERAVSSPNCFSEIRTAARQNKPILVIRLDDTPLDARWSELLDGRREIPVLDSVGARAEAILATGMVGRKYRHTALEKIPWRAVGLAASLLFFLAAAGTLTALATGVWPPPLLPEQAVETPAPTPVPTVPPVLELGEAARFFAASFPDSQQEMAIRRALAQPEGEIFGWQLAEISALHFCGNLVMNNADGIRFQADGACRVNGAPIIQGRISDLSLFAKMPRLEQLTLNCQPLKDLSKLNGLSMLRELSLAGSTVTDLGALYDLPGLEILHLEHTAVTDLRPLETLPRLQTVTVSRGMLPLQWSETKPFSVILVNDAP